MFNKVSSKTIEEAYNSLAEPYEWIRYFFAGQQ